MQWDIEIQKCGYRKTRIRVETDFDLSDISMISQLYYGMEVQKYGCRVRRFTLRDFDFSELVQSGSFFFIQ